MCISLLAIDIGFKGGSINDNIPQFGYLHTKGQLISEFRPQTKLESPKVLLGCSKNVCLLKKLLPMTRSFQQLCTLILEGIVLNFSSLLMKAAT